MLKAASPKTFVVDLAEDTQEKGAILIKGLRTRHDNRRQHKRQGKGDEKRDANLVMLIVMLIVMLVISGRGGRCLRSRHARRELQHVLETERDGLVCEKRLSLKGRRKQVSIGLHLVERSCTSHSLAQTHKLRFHNIRLRAVAPFSSQPVSRSVIPWERRGMEEDCWT